MPESLRPSPACAPVAPSDGTTVPTLHSGRVLLLAVLLVLAVQLLYTAGAADRLATHGYLGPDSYMRMLRIEKLFNGAGWYDRVSERTNAPYGEILPWGRPLDMILVSLAAAISPFTDERAAIYWAGQTVAPLLAFLLIPLWSWGTRPFLGGGAFLTLLALAAMAPFLVVNFQIGRADHHGLEAVLFVAQLCLALRMATGGDRERLAFPMGLAGGAMVWVSIMGLLSLIAFALFLALRFFRTGGAAGREILLHALGVTLVFSVALPVERPPAELLVANAEKLSVAHWTLALAASATWGAIHLLLRRRPGETARGARIAALLLGAALPLGLAGALFPQALLGPTEPYAAEVVEFYFRRVAEFQPLLPTSIETLSKMLIHMGSVLIAAGFVAYDYRTAPAERRAVYDVIIVGFAVYIPMALWVRRFALFAQILALLPFFFLLARIMTWTRTVPIGGFRLPLRGFVVIAALLGPVVAGLIVQRLAPPSTGDATIRDWAAIGDFLTAYARSGGAAGAERQILFTYQLIGPEMAWRTPYSVVGAPYANRDSIRDSHAIFGAKTDAAAKAVIDRRGVSLVLYCRTETENWFYRDGTSGSLLSRIESGRRPGWLVPVPLPEGLSDRFSLFRVARP